MVGHPWAGQNNNLLGQISTERVLISTRMERPRGRVATGKAGRADIFYVIYVEFSREEYLPFLLAWILPLGLSWPFFWSIFRLPFSIPSYL